MSEGSVTNVPYCSKFDFSSDGQCIRCFYAAGEICSFRVYDIAGSTFGKDLLDTESASTAVAAPSVPLEGEDGGEGGEPASAGPSGIRARAFRCT